MLDPNDIGDLPNDGRPPPFRPVQPPRPPGMEGNYGSGSDMEASPFGVSGMMNNPENRKQMLRMGMEYGQVYLKSRYFPFLGVLWSSLKTYFHVDTSYVRQRVKVLLFPFTHVNFHRAEEMDYGAGEEGTPIYKPPVEDENAPDLYIPVMSFITFVLLTGLLKGTQMDFTPEVLTSTMSTAIVTQILEILLIKFSLYLRGLSVKIPWGDLVAYSGYKYLGCTLILLGIHFGRAAYYLTLTYCGACMVWFMFKTISVNCDIKRKYDLVVLGVSTTQILVMWWLSNVG